MAAAVLQLVYIQRINTNDGCCNGGLQAAEDSSG